MSYNNQQQAPVIAYPAAVGKGNSQGSYVANAPPPPMGYPTKDGPATNTQQTVPLETTTRGDGFWKGCCAGLCCCCALDCCL